MVAGLDASYEGATLTYNTFLYLFFEIKIFAVNISKYKI